MSNTPPQSQWPPQPPTPPPAGGAYPPQQPPYPSAPPPLNVPQGYPGAYQSGPVGSPMGSFGVGPSFVVARRSGGGFFKFILLVSVLLPAALGFFIWRAASHDANNARKTVNEAVDKATKTANKALDDAQKQIDEATKKAKDESKKATDAATKAGANVSTAVSDATGALDTIAVADDGSSSDEGTDQGISADGGTVNLFAGTGAGDAIAAIAEARAANPLKALEVNLYPEYVIAQVQDPNTPANVDEFMFRDSQVSDPNPVKLFGEGDLESNLFSAGDVNWGAVPGLVAAALQQINIEGGQVTHIHISRNLPFTSDIQIRVFVDGTRQDGYLDADAKGNITNVTVN